VSKESKISGGRDRHLCISWKEEKCWLDAPEESKYGRKRCAVHRIFQGPIREAVDSLDPDGRFN
jgi:hypothetical protein